MTEREALKLALEALKQIDEAMPFPVAKLAQAAIKQALAQPESEYERGFIDGMQKQMQSSVDKAVNAMSRTWVGLTDEEQKTISDLASANDWHDFDVMDATEAKLKEKNND